jgi:hypothetical protein
MCRTRNNGHRRCPSCTSYPAQARANGNRRMGRLARRKVATHLHDMGLKDTAAAVLSAPPSVLADFVEVVGIDSAVLGDTPLPGASPTAATELITVADAELDKLGAPARAKVAAHLQGIGLKDTAAAVLSASPSVLAGFVEAVGIDTAVLGDSVLPPRLTPAGSVDLVSLADTERDSLARLARRKVAAHLQTIDLPDTAAAVLCSPPSVLAELMDAVGIDTAILGDTPMPQPGDHSAAKLINAAETEHAARRAARKAARSTVIGGQRASLHRGAAVRLAQAVSRSPVVPMRGKPAAVVVPNCRTGEPVVEKWETQAEDVFSYGTRAACRDACAEAEKLCKGCPLMVSCGAGAKERGYTGVAGGRIFVNGRHRLTPSNPARIVAA